MSQMTERIRARRRGKSALLVPPNASARSFEIKGPGQPMTSPLPIGLSDIHADAVRILLAQPLGIIT